MGIFFRIFLKKLGHDLDDNQLDAANQEAEGDDDDLEDREELADIEGPELSPFVPTSPGELLLALSLLVPHVNVLVKVIFIVIRIVINISIIDIHARNIQDNVVAK